MIKNKYNGIDELFVIENLKNYNEYIYNLFNKYLNKSDTILDFGAGIGTLSKYFKKNTIHLFEIDNFEIEYLKNKNYIVKNDLSNIPNEYYNFIYSSNVFEHIKNDDLVLSELFTKLKINGILCLYLPAFSFLWTDLDNKVNHYRRYNKRLIYNLISTLDHEIIEISFHDQLGALSILFLKYIPFFKKIDLIKNSLFYDKYLFKLNFLFYRIFKSYFGKNIFITIKKK